MKKIFIGTLEVAYKVVRKDILHTYLRVKEDHLLITTNKSISDDDIQKFIKKNEHLLLKRLSQPSKLLLYSEEFIELFGTTYPLITSQGIKNKVIIVKDHAELTYKDKEKIHYIIERFYQTQVIEEATRYMLEIKEKVSALLPIEGYAFKAQLMKTQFGSCHSKKRIIKLNTSLGRFDKKFLHSTICHEVVHFKIKGHQKNFYQQLNKIDPESISTNQELKKIYRKYEV